MLLSDVVVADVSEAQEICRAGRAQLDHWPRIESRGVDNLMFAALWEVLTDGTGGRSLMDGDEHVLHVENGGEQLVFHLPDDLRDRLAALTKDQIGPIAARWVEHEELSFDNVTVDVVEPYLVQLADFARRAVQSNKSLLLWICC